MEFKTSEKTAFCSVCGKRFLKHSNIQKYCGEACRTKVQREQNREWLREYYRRVREEKLLDASNVKRFETIEEVVVKANAAGMTYGKYVALQREMEGCDAYGRKADVHTEDH